ncbi:hypothetical protein XA68_12648 [Ophiocordyceps unilateralis]|uniref:MARVEL domain-containing protein n=1 Tax=Ophiocordyceps unilateralis TaxID=268505 RepID=A0A2A9PE90_OPHUN|nr:hypothetical protein XA68_12648 [Ophiocordyceps unilateralis]
MSHQATPVVDPPQTRKEIDVLQTPAWVLGVRIAQSVLSLLILALAATIATRNYIDESGLALAVALMTWLAITYMTLTERLPSLRTGYHVVAVLALDGLLVVLWLAAFAALAARRALFWGYTAIEGLTSATAGLGSLEWILFIITFVWGLVSFIQGRKQGRFPLNGFGVSTTEDCPMESKTGSAQPAQPPAPTQSLHPTQSPYTPPSPSPYTPPQQSPYSDDALPHAQGGGGGAVVAYGSPSPVYGFHQQQQQQQPYRQPQGSELPAQELPFSTTSAHAGSPTNHA